MRKPKPLFLALALGMVLSVSGALWESGRLIAQLREIRIARAEATALKARGTRIARAFPTEPDDNDLAALKTVYAGPSRNWPATKVLPDAEVKELEAFTLPPKPEGGALLRAELGRSLFEDRRLSESGQISCQSCHNRELGWGDGLRASFGHDRQKGKRNAPALFNASLRDSLFWDGRAVSLQQQAMGPMVDPKEMANHNLTTMLDRLNANGKYRRRFRAAYGSDGITLDQVTDALAAFQSTLEERSRFDRFMAGNTNALTDEQVWGMHLFRTKAGCMNCHSGPLFTDEKFHNLGLSLLGRPLEDAGRYNISRAFEDVGRFRTPSLRHTRLTAPYMHNGLIRELRLVVRFYETGGGRTRPRNEAEAANPLMPFAGKTSPLVEPFRVTARERQALVSFLESL